MKNIKKSEKYEALGFVEALISIMVVGASAIVLMQIAATTMQKMIQGVKSAYSAAAAGRYDGSARLMPQ